MPVAIIGMHRSGTSMVSRMLNLCGVFLGDVAEMVPAHESNKSGHWEHMRVVKLNDRLLAAFGGTWSEPPIFPADWLDAPAVAGVREDARAFIAETFASVPGGRWGWKDPRATLTLPFWRALTSDLQAVVCVRNPLDVAASLAARNHMTLAKALALWHFYTAEALRLSEGHPRLIVAYESFFPDYRRGFDPILRALRLPAVEPGSEQDRAIQAFARADLKHHSHTLADVLDHPEVPRATKELYATLAHSGEAEASPRASLAIEDRRVALRGVIDAETAAERQAYIKGLKDHLQKQEAAIADLRAAQESAEAEREQAVTYAREVEQAMDDLRAAREDAEAERGSAVSYARDVERAMEDLRTAQQDAVSYARDLDRTLDDLRAGQQQADAERQAAVSYARDLERALDDLRSAQRQAEAERQSAMAYARDLERAHRAPSFRNGARQ